MEGLPPGLAMATFSAPAGEVVVMLDREANRLAEPLDVFGVHDVKKLRNFAVNWCFHTP